MRIAIIGAGASGICSIKECLQEGHTVVAFEKEEAMGGLWRFSDQVGKGGTVYRSTIILTSKEMSAFSDFPPPKEFPTFMPHDKVLKYFELYCEKFNIYQCIKFNTYVHNVEEAPNYEETGKWNITYSAVDNHEHKKTETFDAVMVCSGHHWDPLQPRFEGMDEFEGRQLHSHDYKDAQGFKDKRLVVVGVGNSGCDIASELGFHAKNVFLSTRRGAWIMSRLGPKGEPSDHINSRFYKTIMPYSLLSQLSNAVINERFDHAKYGIKPNHATLAQHPTINDLLPVAMAAGRVKVKTNIERLDKQDVYFDDGTVERDIDAIIYATGYKISFKFLNKIVVNPVNESIDLYKLMYLPDLKHQTLCIIGLIQPLGSIMPISELQARHFLSMLAKRSQLPSAEQMRKYMQYDRDREASIRINTLRHRVERELIPYMDSIATDIGVRPKIWKYFFTDPKFALKLIFGPCIATQYRLEGYGKIESAKDIINQLEYRLWYPFKTRKVDSEEPKSYRRSIILAVTLIAAAIYIRKHPSLLRFDVKDQTSLGESTVNYVWNTTAAVLQYFRNFQLFSTAK